MNQIKIKRIGFPSIKDDGLFGKYCVEFDDAESISK